MLRHGKIQRIVFARQGAKLTLLVPHGDHIAVLLIADKERAAEEPLARPECVTDLLKWNFRRFHPVGRSVVISPAHRPSPKNRVNDPAPSKVTSLVSAV